MRFHRPPTPEEQQVLDERTFRLILTDYHLCKERNLFSAVPHLEKAVVRWVKKVNGIPENDNDTEPPNI